MTRKKNTVFNNELEQTGGQECWAHSELLSCIATELKDSFIYKWLHPMTDKTDPPDLIDKVKSTPFNKGCFLFLAGGTLPVLFISPLDYIITLGVCYILTRILSKILF